MSDALSQGARLRGAGPHAWDPIVEAIRRAGSIAISGHTNPDGDALGSALGLSLALKDIFPDKRVTALLADDAPIPRVYRFLPGSGAMVPAARYAEAPDLFISVDAPTLERLEGSAEVARRARSIVSIDHHPARGEFAASAVRDVDAAATAVLVSELLDALGSGIGPDIATCLFCGLVTDTGRFQYQNADPRAFDCAARLVALGADPAKVALEVYQSQRTEYLRLEGLVMGRIRTAADGLVAYSYATAGDLAACGVDHDECDGLIDAVRQVAGAQVCLFLKDGRTPGLVRGNLRSKGALDVSAVASRHDGGGHAAAAGFSFKGTVEEALAAVLPELVELVEG